MIFPTKKLDFIPNPVNFTSQYGRMKIKHDSVFSYGVLGSLAKYPDIVTLPEGLLGDYIILRNPKLSGFELMIVWKIHIDEEGRTTPVLDLLTKVPEQVLQQKMATIETAPARFRSMLLLFGIETAIENLIKVVGLEK
ncbi:centromere protein P [Grus japonensis]|uniref:Centromere protein P n=1 Tax=Grus japonensis TaxID=30415 RepID=A0ABC9XAT7_GRUJA